MKPEKKLKAGVLYEYTGDPRNTRAVTNCRVLKEFHDIETGDVVLATGNVEKVFSLWWSQVFHLRWNKVMWMVTGTRFSTGLFKRLDSKRVSDKTKEESEGGT